LALLLAGVTIAPARLDAQGVGLAETLEAIAHARVATRILYVTAHPDDEPAGVLTYLARGLGAEVALLSITRGEGGQNALGPEQGPRLGLLRTEELLAATRRYGVRLYFTRAPDFGYSKTPEETLKIWGDTALEDMVRVIRMFRPHIIINHWAGVRTGHGHHQASGLLTPQAFDAAADPKAFPGQFAEGLQPWRTPLLLNQLRSEVPGGLRLPTDQLSPLWGKTYNELGLEGFVNHRTQGVAGFRNSPFFRAPRYLVPAQPAAPALSPSTPLGINSVEGAGPFATANLAEPLLSIAGRFPQWEGLLRAGLESADQSLAAARTASLRLDWAEAARQLAQAGSQIAELRRLRPLAGARDALQEIEHAEEKIDAALALAAGLHVEAQADRGELVAGENFVVRAESRCRPEVHCAMDPMRIGLPAGMETVQAEGNEKEGFRFTVAVRQNVGGEICSSRWSVSPLPPPLVTVRQNVRFEGISGGPAYGFSLEVPVQATRVTSTRVDTLAPSLVPAVTLTLEPGQSVLLRQRPPKQIELRARVRYYGSKPARVIAGLDLPEGWSSSSAETLEFPGPGDRLVRFLVASPASKPAAAGTYKLAGFATLASANPEFRCSLEPLPSLPTQLWREPALAAIHAFDMEIPEDLRVGYVAAANDPIPEFLQQLGIRVEALDEVALAFSDLRRLDAIAIGIRAYELRPDLSRANRRLLDYVAAGGTLVVQYQREADWTRLQPAPYPATIGQPAVRVTDENSPVRFLRPESPLVNFPNKITARDFQGWMQERGLYFWSQFDRRYEPILGLQDPGEEEATGGLLAARYGQGLYIYTGLSFFRQIPEGVPGAFRLFINLLSQSRVPKKAP